ncbi:hypothetical protein RN001_011457 [Aquatica leii]|uniref:COMM domain-containing protein n=1 Tax=Aquatica leii TaxID=1421715 RepID=A0AAN7NXE8_9COLE|nr:hypothetical protein RN001_011457 [Aquatica leii]
MAATLLKITNEEALHRFLHNCVDDLITKNHSNFNVGNDDIEWTKDDHRIATNYVQNLYKENVLKSENWENVIKTVTPKYQQIIKECYDNRKSQIYQAVLCDELHKTNANIVQNIDWKLKWIMGSSKLATLREPLLQVDLHCFRKENENTRKTVNFEMDIGQVNKLILDLEKVKQLITSP